MVKFTPGGRYIHSIRAHLSRRDPKAQALSAPPLRMIRDRLDDPRVKRLIVDSRQMAVLAASEQMPVLEELRLPFDHMYIEFTDPVHITELEPGYGDDRGTVAILIWLLREGALDEFPALAENGHPMVAVHAFVEGVNDGDWADRTLGVNLYNGKGLATLGNCLAEPEPSQFSDDFIDNNSDLALFEARTEGLGIGWWERQIATYGEFVTYLLMYMGSQSVHIVEVPLNRQQQRAMDRQSAKARPDHQPKAWHMVMVKPKRGAAETTGTGRSHSYRYDVIGHLKLGRHHLKDGSIREKVEWVRPHQRGLKNELYIPGTYGYEGRADVSRKEAL